MTELGRRVRACVWMLLIVSAAACSGSAMEDVTDSNLQAQAKDCKRTPDQGPAMAIQCGNVERECTRRRELGRFVC